MSPELAEILGLGSERFISYRTFVDTFIHEDSRADFDEDLALCQQNNRPLQRVYRARNAKGEEMWIRQNLQTEVEELAGATLLLGAVQDVTREQESEQEIRQLAYYDSLTGVSQRSYLVKRLEEMVYTAKRRRERFALFFIDLDKFKEVNDTLGHEAGDQLLIEVAQRLQRGARESDCVARLGGDEFCVLVDNVDSEVGVAVVANRLLEQLSQPIEIQGKTLTPQASLGIAMYPEDGREPEELLRAGDNAMYAAKRRGEHSFVFHEHNIAAEADQRLRTSRELRDAFRRQQFSLHYQPLVDIASGRACGWEALVRWEHPERGRLDAGQFVPDLERLGLARQLGEHVIDAVCRQLAQWQ